jgi:LytS/YehU family sensor histidine kinase
LSSLIDENPNQAQKFTASMSKIYRYVLEQKDKELVTVEDEIEFAKTYCDLLKPDSKTVSILFLMLRKKIIGNM